MLTWERKGGGGDCARMSMIVNRGTNINLY